MSAFTEVPSRDVTSVDLFRSMAKEHDMVPVIWRGSADGVDPADLFQGLNRSDLGAFLLESGGSGRYSFVGVEPERVFSVADGGESLRAELDSYLHVRRPKLEGLPPFTGGVAGYFGYGMAEAWEPLFHGTDRRLRKEDTARAVLMGFTSVVAVDHETDELFLIRNVRIPSGASEKEVEDLYRSAVEFLEDLAKTIDTVVPAELPTGPAKVGPIEAEMDRKNFLEMVEKGKEHIVAGDVCQVVLSQAFSAETDLSSDEIYRALREGNPSPYLFRMEFPGLELIGSSPEVHVKLERGRALIRPLAGTRKRGSSEERDLELEKELRTDEKERAEHVMLVDLARNDLGRTCSFDSVEVTELLGVERYSQVMHLVSQVEGRIRHDESALDLLETSFPAGTVSGAPKIRAMEIIEDLEPSPRGPYAGAVGYVGFDGDMDTCIAIRTMSRRGNRITVQAGAGIVYDSVPEMEYMETENKARALFKALERAAEKRSKR
ncbi:Anthranilate synthase [Dethiosulfovibrio peptidovorans DSM 11002]|uniref:Anthranilate synthase n=1 Tax=Dethiosulfovibrio peptidovorans DSM 11002 TaxID=469381 RepID=D2Z6F8_9BACT|nr:anthranilate synthase component I [Dethiosulfovibrio peptidovorans]EFC91055.1 Anthranilate synthase [Dethiosulfovibrio peptidovorans DSM 11002]